MEEGEGRETLAIRGLLSLSAAPFEKEEEEGGNFRPHFLLKCQRAKRERRKRSGACGGKRRINTIGGREKRNKSPLISIK